MPRISEPDDGRVTYRGSGGALLRGRPDAIARWIALNREPGAAPPARTPTSAAAAVSFGMSEGIRQGATGAEALDGIRDRSSALYAEATAVSPPNADVSVPNVPPDPGAARRASSGDLQKFEAMVRDIMARENVSAYEAYNKIRLRDPSLWTAIAAPYASRSLR